MPRLVAFLGMATLAPIAATAQTAHPPWLVGGWAQKGDYCASGSPLVFKGGGAYINSGGDFTGTWSLKGRTLSLVSRSVEIDVDRAGQPVKSVGPIKRETAFIRRLSPDHISIGRDEFRRCSPNGGSEPWHPKERIYTH